MRKDIFYCQDCWSSWNDLQFDEKWRVISDCENCRKWEKITVTASPDYHLPENKIFREELNEELWQAQRERYLTCIRNNIWDLKL